MNATPMNPLLAKVHDFASVIDYQEGSVVSREIVRKEIGTITVFAFDLGTCQSILRLQISLASV